MNTVAWCWGWRALTGRREQLLGGRGVLVRAALGEQAQLHGARLEGDRIAGCFQSLCQRHGFGQRLLGPAELCEERGAHAGDPERELGDAATPAEVDSLPAGIQCRSRPLVLPGVEREVVVQDGRGAALTPFERERQRPAHVLESLRVPQRGAGRAAHAERLGRLGQPELCGQLERLLGGRNRLSVGAADGVPPASSA